MQGHFKATDGGKVGKRRVTSRKTRSKENSGNWLGL